MRKLFPTKNRMGSQTRKNLKSVPFNVIRGCPPGYQKRTSYKNGNHLFMAPRCVAKGTGDCPRGMIKRKAYTRRYSTGIRHRGYTVKRRTGTRYRVYPETTRMVVRSACIKDRGLAGKGPRQGKGIGLLKQGRLKRYGYSYHIPVDNRRHALKKAIQVYGAVNVFHKLDAVMKYSMRTAPDASRVFKEDRDWVRNKFM